MTKIYIYCLFDFSDRLLGVYSSIQAVHRDAVRYTNRGRGQVYMVTETEASPASLTGLRNMFKGKYDVSISYRTSSTFARIYKTKLKE
jgi:hypothetical protein